MPRFRALHTFPPGTVVEEPLDPYRMLRTIVGGLLLAGTAFALVLWLAGDDPRALILAGAFWSIYGIALGFIDGLLEPVTDFLVNMFQNVGLVRAGGGYSAIEALEAKGLYDAAANEYLERARQGPRRAEAMLRRAALLAGPLRTPEAAAAELENLRDTGALKPSEDLRVGLVLADLFEHSLNDPGRAMAELRRLIDRYPGARRARQLRATLHALKAQRFGGT